MTLRTTFYARHCCSFSTSFSGWRQGHRPRPPQRRARKASSLALTVTSLGVLLTGVSCRVPHHAALLVASRGSSLQLFSDPPCPPSYRDRDGVCAWFASKSGCGV